MAAVHNFDNRDILLNQIAQQRGGWGGESSTDGYMQVSPQMMQGYHPTQGHQQGGYAIAHPNAAYSQQGDQSSRYQ